MLEKDIKICGVILDTLNMIEKSIENSKEYIKVFKESIKNPENIKTSKEDYDNFQRILTINNETLEKFKNNANNNIEALDFVVDAIAKIYYKG